MALDNPGQSARIMLPPLADVLSPAALHKVARNPTMANTFYEHLSEWITDAMERAEEEGKGVEVVCHVGGSRITVTGLGFHNPYMIAVYGEDGAKNAVELLAHMAGIQLVITFYDAEEERQPRPIGFRGSLGD
jgi:hypothetical protein